MIKNTVLFFLISIVVQAQNVVLNPALENYITCPGFGQFSNTYINDWTKPSWGSTDYYNDSCAGIQPSQQRPRSGHAYAGIIGYNYGQEYREYMTGTLNAPLIPGATYYCEFYVNLNDGYIQAIKELGAYFSAAVPGPYNNALHIAVTPQVQNTNVMLDDTMNWLRVSGYFLALGGEQYITIGNFNDDANTTIATVGSIGSYGSYYFVDDVWVSLSEGTGIDDHALTNVNIYPNPVSNSLCINSSSIISSVIISTMEESIVFSSSAFNSAKAIINVEDLAPGMYIAEIMCGNKISRKKIIKQE